MSKMGSTKLTPFFSDITPISTIDALLTMISIKARYSVRSILWCVLSLSAAHAIAAPIAIGESFTARPASSTATSFPAVPIVNWSVPQFFGASSGVTSSMANSFVSGTSKVNTKAVDLGLSVFQPLVPCRLVDTRGLFSPVYAGGPFSNGEVRTYQTIGHCGIPNVNSRIKAVSLAITTLPSSASGDVETVPHGAALGNTVDMVVQANEWNSVAKIVRVDAFGQFDMQVRNTFGDLAIDINGYYGDTSNIGGEFYSVVGTYAIDGGLFYIENTSAIGAALRAYNSDPTLPGTSAGDVRLAQGTSAIDIAGGQIRARGAGTGTATPAFIHQVTAGNLCTDNRYTWLNESHVSGSNATSGQMLFVQDASHTGTDTSTPRLIRTVFATVSCGGAPANSWFLFTNTTFAVGQTYNVLLINP